MTVESSSLNPTTFFRQPDKPPSAADGALWIDTADGASGKTTSRYRYNQSQSRWELDSAVGSEEPTDGTVQEGALWRDSNASPPAKQYDGSSWQTIGKSDAAVQEQAIAVQFVMGGS